MICSRMKFVEGTRSGQCNCPLQRIVSEPYWRRLELEEGFERDGLDGKSRVNLSGLDMEAGLSGSAGCYEGHLSTDLRGEGA